MFVVNCHVHLIEALGNNGRADKVAYVVERGVRRIDDGPDSRKDRNEGQRHAERLKQNAGHDHACALYTGSTDGKDKAEEHELERASEGDGEAVEVGCKDAAQTDEHGKAGHAHRVARWQRKAVDILGNAEILLAELDGNGQGGRRG